MKSDLSFEFGSFRDPAGKVFFVEDSVFRTVSKDCVDKIKFLLNMPFFEKLMLDGKIVKTKIVNNTYKEISETHILEHEKVKFITYPYECSFSMLKDAAILTLELLKDCLLNNFILKDGTAWNCSYHNGRMVFFDVLSIDTYKPGQAWNGYQQFCKEFLYPLLLKSYKNINFHDIFKGSLDGIDPQLMSSCFSWKDIFKPGIFKHIYLNAFLSKNKSVSELSIKNNYSLPKESLLKIVDNLLKIIRPLESCASNSVWIDYSVKNTYEKDDSEIKREFLNSSFDDMNKNNSILDLGANVGVYSRSFSGRLKVIACDIDADCVDVIYRKNSAENGFVTPFVLNLMNPSANRGWNLQERKSIVNRLQVDAFMALALIHHICIANNVPIDYFVSFLRNIAKKGVIEWVDKKDPMVKFLLRNREDIFTEYNWGNFEKIVSKYFLIKRKVVINNGFRTLCFVDEK